MNEFKEIFVTSHQNCLGSQHYSWSQMFLCDTQQKSVAVNLQLQEPNILTRIGVISPIEKLSMSQLTRKGTVYGGYAYTMIGIRHSCTNIRWCSFWQWLPFSLNSVAEVIEKENTTMLPTHEKSYCRWSGGVLKEPGETEQITVPADWKMPYSWGQTESRSLRWVWMPSLIGHLITKEHSEVNLENVSAIWDVPTPGM